MVTSSLINSTLGLRIPITVVRRTSPWFGRYDHCLRFPVIEASTLRRLDHAHIDRMIQIRRSWGMRLAGRQNFGGSWRGSWEKIEISDQDVAHLHRLCDFFGDLEPEHKLYIHGDLLYVYDQGGAAIQQVIDQGFVDSVPARITVVDQVGQPSSVYLKHPKNLYRSYLRYRVLSAEQAQSIKGYLSRQTDLKPSRSLQQWIDQDWKNPQEYYFVDHDDQAVITMLGLICPGIVRKTLPIVAAK